MSTKTGYVDGFVFVIKKDKIEEYKKMAKQASELWMKYGALAYKECMGEDLKPSVPPEMEGMERPRTFLDLVKPEPDEVVWFSYIEYESRAKRDEVNKKVMSDSSMQMSEWKDKPMPFAMQQMTTGGFSVEVGL